MAKRGEDAVGGQLVEAKRPRTELVASGAGASGGGALAVSGPARTSDLLSPIMLLTGHTGQVLTTKFSPDGKHLLSGSHDKLVLLWEVFGECKNTLTLKGHQNAVLELHWSSDGEHAFTASADKTVALWDTATGGRVRQFKGHQGFVNTVCPARDGFVLASGSDDGSARLWDARVRTCARVLGHPFPVTAVSMAHDGDTVYTGCLDGLIRVYDVRRPGEPSMVLEGHQDIVTGLRVSPDADFLLSNAMDNTLRCWDVKPYASGDRCTKIFLGAQARAAAAAARAARPRRPPAPPARPRLRRRPRRRRARPPPLAALVREVAAQVQLERERQAGGVRLGRQLRLRLGRDDGADRVQAARPPRLGQRGRLPPDPADHRVVRQRQANLPRRDQACQVAATARNYSFNISRANRRQRSRTRRSHLTSRQTP